MLDRTHDEIKQNSKHLMKTYCDKEQVFYAKKKDNTLNKMNKKEDTESGEPLRKHDLIRKKSKERNKLRMIE